MTTLEEMADEELYPASNGEVNHVYACFTVKEILTDNRFVATRKGVAVVCHGPGGHFEPGPVHPSINRIRYRGNSQVEKPIVEVQDVVLCQEGTAGATTVWSTPDSHKRAEDELALELAID